MNAISALWALLFISTTGLYSHFPSTLYLFKALEIEFPLSVINVVVLLNPQIITFFSRAFLYNSSKYFFSLVKVHCKEPSKTTISLFSKLSIIFIAVFISENLLITFATLEILALVMPCFMVSSRELNNRSSLLGIILFSSFNLIKSAL